MGLQDQHVGKHEISILRARAISLGCGVLQSTYTTVAWNHCVRKTHISTCKHRLQRKFLPGSPLMGGLSRQATNNWKPARFGEIPRRQIWDQLRSAQTGMPRTPGSCAVDSLGFGIKRGDSDKSQLMYFPASPSLILVKIMEMEQF